MSLCEGQTFLPESLDASPGVHLYTHDGLEHRSSSHYATLCRIVNAEFGIKVDSLSVHVVFIDQETRDRMRTNNPTRFREQDWLGAFIQPSLILILGEEESDDTFMHEYMHMLRSHGLLFPDAQPSSVHTLIDWNEGLLLGSKAYLDYLKTRPK
jgi:hypothetical protein